MSTDESKTLQTEQQLKPRSGRGSLPMMKLTLPLVGEQFLRILVSSVDTFMLSSYSASAVAGVGLVNQWTFFIMVLFNVICIGSNIVLAQFLGANKSDKELNHIAKAGLMMISVMAVSLMILVLSLTKLLLSFYTLEPEVHDAALKYFMIYGGVGSLVVAFSSFQMGILRTYGYTRQTLLVSIISNIINVFGNAIAIYGLFGIPVTGTSGVAAASIIALFVGCIIMFFMIRRRKDIQFKIFKADKVPSKIYRMILSIGVPTAGENLSYNIAQITIMAMISSLGTMVMSTQVYAQTISRFVFVMASAIGSAVQIKVGYHVGAGEKDIAYKKVYKYSLVATSCSMLMIVLINLVKAPIIGLFTSDPEVAALTSKLLIVAAYVEFGRSLNLVWVGALKGAGDVKFPVTYGLFSMWGIMVLLSWILGIKLGYGIIGCWIGIGTDETTRGIVMVFRWKTKRWQKKSLV